MAQPADTFYDDMAAIYHLIFDDWDVAIERQQAVLSSLLPPPTAAGVVLDCACGIGTQTLGLAQAGYAVEGIDLSGLEIERAQAEAVARGLDIAFRVDDMRVLRTCELGRFGVVLAFDNALPHLDSDDEVRQALGAMRNRLRPEGKLLVSLRDYGPLMEQRHAAIPPTMFLDDGRRRIVHQIWDWRDERRYTTHLYITRQTPTGRWTTSHFVGNYRAMTPGEVEGCAEQIGFRQVQILSPEKTGYYQPVVTAIRA